MICAQNFQRALYEETENAGTSFWRGNKAASLVWEPGKPQIPKSRGTPHPHPRRRSPKGGFLQDIKSCLPSQRAEIESLQLYVCCCCLWPAQTPLCWIVFTFQSVQSHPVVSLWAVDVLGPLKHVFCAYVSQHKLHKLPR